jgi:hypothetical protein
LIDIFQFAHETWTWHRLIDLFLCFRLVEFSYRPLYPTPYPNPATALQHRMLGAVFVFSDWARSSVHASLLLHTERLGLVFLLGVSFLLLS